MTKTDLFRVVIKLFGIYSFINALFQLIPNVSYSRELYKFNLVTNTIFLIFSFLISYFLLFKTNNIVKILRLEKGFDNNNIELKNLSADVIFKFALIFTGILFIVNNLAQFIDFCYLAFKEQVSSNGLNEIDGAMLEQQLDYHWGLISGLNILIGFIFLTNYKWICKLFMKK